MKCKTWFLSVGVIGCLVSMHVSADRDNDQCLQEYQSKCDNIAPEVMYICLENAEKICKEKSSGSDNTTH